MNLIELKIASIENLGFIYVYELETTFDSKENTYIGMKIIYNGNQKLDLSYRDAQFEKYVTKVLEKYAEEKSGGQIILLGDLTRKLLSESSFAVLNKEKKTGNQVTGMPAFNTSARPVKRMDTYLKETLKTILLVYKNYELLDIEKIDGFGNKYVVYYNIGSVSKKMPIIISKSGDNKIDFKIGIIDNTLVPISGSIVSDGGCVYANWNSDDLETVGELIFEPQTGVVKRKVETNNVVVHYDGKKDVVLEADLEKILFYSELCGIKDINKFSILKTDKNSFLLGEVTSTEEKDGELISTIAGIQVDSTEDEMRITYTTKNVLSKYEGNFNKSLDEEIEEIIFRKIEVDLKPCVLLERKYKNKVSNDMFSYEIFEVEGNIDLRKTFTYTKHYKIDKEVRTLENVKEYVRERKGGNK